jgi:phage-related protein
MIGALTLNGQEAEATFGMVVTGFAGDLGTPERALRLLEIPALAGGIDPGVPLREEARTLRIDFLLSAATDTALRTALDPIAAICSTGLVEIQTLYSTTRALYGVLQTFVVERRDATIAGWAMGSMTFLCPIPYWLDISPTTVAFTSATDIPLGTAASAGRDEWAAIITITGAATTPTLTYKDYTGATVGTMAFSYSPLGGDSLVIDCGRHLVTKVVSGVSSNAIGSLTAGYTFPALLNVDASFVASLWPTLEVSSGTGSVTYYRAWR